MFDSHNNTCACTLRYKYGVQIVLVLCTSILFDYKAKYNVYTINIVSYTETNACII